MASNGEKSPATDSERPSGPPLVVIRGLKKRFLHEGAELEVLKGIDLDIRQQEVMSIVGASGAGKSTLLHCIGTLDAPSEGTILLAGEDLTRLSGNRLASIRNRLIGFVFQFHHLLAEFNAVENVMMPGLIQKRPRSEMMERAKAMLAEVGLTHRLTHRPGELSGGEQQRVAIARAVVLEPKLLLADEPTGNLDSATSDAVHDLFFEIADKRGMTVVVVTHNTRFAARMPRVVELKDGRVVHDTRGSGYAARTKLARDIAEGNPTAGSPAQEH